MNTAKLLKLARMVMHFGEIKTNNGALIIDGNAEVGKEVFIEDENGEIVPAPNNDYILEDQTIYVVEDGKIKEIILVPTEEKKPETIEETIEAEEEPKTEEEPKEDEKDLRIAELEGLLKDRDAVIEELTQKIKELEDKNQAPVEKAVEMKASAQKKSNSYSEFFK